MNCMKFRAPQCFNELPKKEQDRLLSLMKESVNNTIFEDEADMQINWIKLACINLRDMGFTEDQLLMFVGSWKNIYRKNAKMSTRAEQQAWLDDEMKQCFPHAGFPVNQVNSMKKV